MQLLETLFSDLRYVGRQLWKSPAFTLTAILTLAVAIGVNLTAFAIVKAIFLQPVPVAHPEQLLAVYSRAQQGQGYYTGVAYKEFEYYHDRNDVLSAFAGYWRITLHLRIADVTESVAGEIVTPEFFSALPVRTVLGRTLQTSPGAAAAETPGIVLSYGLWQSRFNGSRDVVGKTVTLEGYPFTVVGVIDPEFSSVLMDWLDPPQLWIPMDAIARTAFSSLTTNWKANSMMTVGRMKPGVTIDEAATEFQTLDARMSQDNPERLRAWNGHYDFRTVILPIQKARFFPGYRELVTSYIEVVAIAVGMVLLIACLNLANLTIARATARQREWAVRAALGADRLRLLTQSFIETVLLCSAGAAGGLFIASWAWRALPLYGRPFRVVLPADLEIDPEVLLVTLALAAITGLIFGVWPSLRVTRVDVNAALKQQPETRTLAGIRIRSILIAAQVAISVILLVGAGLFVQTVQNARAADRIVDLDRVGFLSIDLYASDYSPERKSRFLDEVLRNVRSLPSVEKASYGSTILGLFTTAGGAGRLIDRVACHEQTLPVDKKVAAAEYFDTLRIPILEGRDFSDHDRAQLPASVIVNETLAKKCWPGADPIGQELKWGDTAMSVIGVVKDTNTRGFRSKIEPAVYSLPAPPNYYGTTLLVRTASDLASWFPAIRNIVRQTDPNIAVTVQTIEEQIDSTLSQERLTATLCVALGAIALGLTLVGLYGIVTLSVTARTKEIGIRMAIGAATADVLNLVLRQTVLVVLAGTVVGLGGAVTMARSASALLYGLSPFDATSFLFAAILLAVCASIAAFIPARRAGRVDPSSALRHE